MIDATAPLSLVLDTNVVLDLLVWDDPWVRPLREALEHGRVLAWANARTLGELKYVLAYPTFALDAEAQHAAFTRYARHVRLAAEDAAPPASALPRCRDRADQKFLELAARVGATWLVSKDKRVLSMADRVGLPFGILSVRQLAERLAR
jgi:uncharacterized protein